MAEYVIGIDQSTQGTKALLFDGRGKLISRADFAHRQIINEKGWVEHDPEEFYANLIKAVKLAVEKAGIHPDDIAAAGISNQRETALAWRLDGTPVYNAVVWQCKRGEEICRRLEEKKEVIRAHTGLRLSPYFSAAKIAWILENVEEAKKLSEEGNLRYGTVDSFLIYRLTGGKVYRTDYSNASRTQMFDICNLKWDEEICGYFGIDVKNLAEVTNSDGYYGETDFEGYLSHKIPIHGVLGDSHGALFAQGCIQPGMVKATYGTGSSVMMNVGEKPVFSDKGLVSSLAFAMGGKVNYVLEGNINYTGAVISWLIKDLGLIKSAEETEELARKSNPADHTYLVPAFTGLGAPYWDSEASAAISGMTRTTGKAELVRAALESIAYQIDDIVEIMESDSGIPIQELRVDGGPTRNSFLMETQSNISGITVKVPQAEELSGIGAAYAAFIGAGICQRDALFSQMQYSSFEPSMNKEIRQEKKKGWKAALKSVLSKIN